MKPWKLSKSILMIALAILLAVIVFLLSRISWNGSDQSGYAWSPPDSTLIALLPDAQMISYGQELVTHTSLFLGPQGSVMSISNGMNCQNCHLRVGKKNFGNNFSAVASTYPKHRDRSGGMESIEKRVNDCIERSLNGKRLDEQSREMKAFVAYIRWVGKDVPQKTVPVGAGLVDLPLLERAANPQLGMSLYQSKCRVCHGSDGNGLMKGDGKEYAFPPLWGNGSFNTGAGIFRLSRMAGYIKVNMPNGARSDSTLLSDEEAWDLAAYINSMPRPTMNISADWPNISTKPVDHPFGPYADSFSEAQHKYGPFQPIIDSKKKME